MWNQWATRVSLSIVVGGALLVTPVGPDRAAALAVAEDIPPARITIPPGEDPLGAQSTPSASITAPSAAIGDYGASRGNVWDMDSTDDIVAQQEPFPLEERPELGTMVRGYTPGRDLAIGFYASETKNFPSSQYHQLLYRLRIAAGPHASCATNGRVLYATRWPKWLGYQEFTRAYSPEDAPMYCDYGKFCVYYMDLSRNDNDGRSPYFNTWFTNPSPWPTDSIKAFGMWPHEVWYDCGSSDGDGPAYFDIDYVYLTGDIMATAKAGYKYTARWTVSDPGGGTITATIRYMQVDELRLPSDSPACNRANFDDQAGEPPPAYPNKLYLPLVRVRSTSGGKWQDFSPAVQTTTSLPGTSSQSYSLDFSDNTKFTDGKSYYLCIKVDDGTTRSYTVSTAPVIRAPLSPNFGPE